MTQGLQAARTRKSVAKSQKRLSQKDSIFHQLPPPAAGSLIACRDKDKTCTTF